MKGTTLYPHRPNFVRVVALAIVGLVSGACEARGGSDAYDPAERVLGSPPASVTSERHAGAFAEGDALSTAAELRPLSPDPVKTIRLDATHKVVEIAPGVAYSAWTFGDQVPGPTVRARVGSERTCSRAETSRLAS